MDTSGCAFDERLKQQIFLARQRAKAGLVDEDDFDSERRGQSAARVFEELLLQCPQSEDLLVTHGDATFENLITLNGQFAGFVDCGRLGVADRYRDVALISRSIAERAGIHWVQPFFRLYGQAIDIDRIKFYQLLDEFF